MWHDILGIDVQATVRFCFSNLKITNINNITRISDSRVMECGIYIMPPQASEILLISSTNTTASQIVK
jgi:hypothetical protein